MKLTTLLMIIAFVQASAKGYSQINLNEKNVPIEKIITSIEKQSGYVFFYDENDLSHVKVDVKVTNATLDQTLKACFKDLPITYKIVDHNILLKKTSSVNDHTVKAELSTPITVSGKVTDETGQPLPGVTVKQKGTNNGVLTDSNGGYSFNVSDKNTLITFSYIGFETQELIAKDIPNGSIIKLRTSATNLREVVVSKGYYDEKRELSTGNVSVVTAKEISEQPVTDPILALEARVPGLYISQTSGVPGAYSNVMLRGQNSIPNNTSKLPTVNNPLYIVDGVPFESNSLTNINIGGGAAGNPSQSLGQNNSPLGLSPFNNIDPNNIENIEVLKDADATAIYGSRGANGVILITTKKGKAGDTKVDVNISQGIGQVTRQLQLLNTQQYLEMRHEAFKNDGLTPNITDYDVNGAWDTTRYTNWQKLLIGNTAHYTNAQASISGGTANTQFLIGGAYSRQTTVYPGDFSDRKGSIHVNLTHASTDKRFHVQFGASYVNDDSHLPDVDLTSLITQAPDAPAIYNANGDLNWQITNGSPTFRNPLQYNFQNDQSVTNTLTGNLSLGYQLLPGLNLTSNLGYTNSQLNQTNIISSLASAPPFSTNPNSRSIRSATTNVQTWIIEPQLNYSKKVGKGTLDMLLGSTFQENQSNSIATLAFGFANDALIVNPVSATNFYILGDQNALYHYNAIYGRVGFNWEEKYLVNVTGRRDGSSRFGPGRQFGNFGAIGAGWIFSKEEGVSNNLPWLSFGKLRGSYGTTGNDQLKDYQYLSTYTSVSSTYQGTTLLNPTALTNPNAAWEEVRKLEGGLELGFLKDRIFFTASYYRNRTYNQLVGYPLPYISGFSSVQYNLPAIIQNKGVELTLNTTNISSKNFRWTSSVNLSIPNNKLVSYPNIENSDYQGVYLVGQPLFVKQLYHSTGVNPQTGQYTYATNNANGIPSDPQDRTDIASITQKYFGGFQNSFGFKGFHLDVLLQFVKQLGYNYQSVLGQEPGVYNSNQPTVVLGRWQKPGDITTIGEFSTQYKADPNGLLFASNRVLTDASFVRLKNVAFSYQLPVTWQKQTHLKNARIFLQAQNLFTITNYLGLDPETQALSLPPLRMITMGIQASL